MSRVGPCKFLVRAAAATGTSRMSGCHIRDSLEYIPSHWHKAEVTIMMIILRRVRSVLRVSFRVTVTVTVTVTTVTVAP